MLTDRALELAAAFRRPPNDPLVVRIAALIAAVETGTISVAGAEVQLTSDPSLQTARSLLSFRDAEIGGSVSVGDVAGGHIIKIEINLPAIAPPPIDSAAAQQLLATLPLDYVPAVATLPLSSLIPLAHNPLFVGRELELMMLARMLKTGNTAAIAPLTAATGLGGIGKTQMAIEVAHRYGQYFAGGVFWISFADREGVPAAIARCGGAEGLDLRPNFASLPIDQQVALVQAAWRSPLPRLLIFDNCEDEALLDQWRPKTGGCCVLLTSRRQQWDAGLGVQALSLGILPRTESIILLRKFCPDLPDNDPNLHAIAAELGDLPLALHLAGSYLARYRNAITPAIYLAQLRDPALLMHRSLRGVAGRSPTDHDLDVARTFALSYERLDASNPIDALALHLLARAACLAPSEPIPRELLLAMLELPIDNPDVPLQVVDALQQLRDLGLIEVGTEAVLRLHRLVALFVRDQTLDTTAQVAVEQTMQQIATRLNRTGHPAQLVALQAHLRHIVDRAILRADEQAASLGNTFGYHLKMIDDVVGARVYFEQALAIRQRVLGKRHPDTATSLNNLGAVLQDQGDLTRARFYYERALAIRQEVLGELHPDTADSLNNLGMLLKDQGDLMRTLPYLKQALEVYRTTLGEFHPDTVNSLSNLGHLLQAQGDLAGARPYYEQALAIRQMLLGEYHPDTALSFNNLGYLLQEQGKLTEARPYLERALEIYRTVLGERHSDTVQVLNNLGMLLQEQGDLIGARPYLEQALVIHRAVLGEHHPRIAQSLNNLGMLLKAQGDLTGAGPYLEQALVIHQAVLGERHPFAAGSLNNLGCLLHDQGDLAGAQPYFEQALAIRQEVLGKRHPDTATSLNNLAALFLEQDNLSEARSYLEEALAIRQEVLGRRHPDVASSLNNLASLHLALGELATARLYYEQALAVLEPGLGSNHPTTRTVRRHLDAVNAILQANPQD